MGNPPVKGPDVPGKTGLTAVIVGLMSRLTSRLLASLNGETYSYRSPKLKLRLPVALQSSCTNRSQEFCRNS